MREFSLPFKPEELLAQPADDRLWASDLPAVDDWPVGQVNSALDTLIGKILSSHGYQLAEDKSFSLVFALLQAWPRLDDGVGPRIVDLLTDAARRVSAEVKRAKQAGAATNKKEQTKQQNAARDARTAAKVCVFFLRWACERLLRKESAEAVGARRGRGRGKGARAADGDGQEMSAEEAKEAQKAAERLRCGALSECVSLLSKDAMPWLWTGDPAAFQQAAQAVSDAGFCALDNQDMLKHRETKQCAIRCIAEPLQQEGHQHSNLIVVTVSKLMYGLRGGEGGAPFAADVLLAAHTTSLPRTFLVELPSHCNAGELTSQGGFQRALANFLTALSERLPHLVLANIAVLLPLLDVDCYPLRCAIVESIGQLLSQEGKKLPKGAHVVRAEPAAGEGAAADDAGGAPPGDLLPIADADGGGGRAARAAGETHFSIAEATKKDLLETLMTRSLDKSVWVRYRALQTLNHLASHKGASGLPVDLWSRVLGIATRRMQDSASMTRKASMQLISALIAHHPYGPALQGAGDERAKAEKLLREVQARFNELAAEEVAEAEGSAGAGEDGEDAGDAGGAAATQDPDADAEEGAPRKKSRLTKKTVTDKTIQVEVDQVLAEADEGGARQDERQRKREALHRMQDCYTQRLKFIELIDAAELRLRTLLSSRFPTDVTEAISVVVALRQREVPAAARAFDKVLGLIWSRQSSIKDAAVEAFNGMYLDGRDASSAVRSLLDMYRTGCEGGSWTYTHLASVQELIQQSAEKGHIDGKRAIPELAGALKGTSCDMALRALTALGAASSADLALALPKISEAVGPGGVCLGTSVPEKLERVRLVCQLLLRLQSCTKMTLKEDAQMEMWKLSSHATRTVVECFSKNSVPPQWFGAAQSAMDLSFDLAMSATTHTDPIQRCPDKLWEQILNRMLCGLLPQGSGAPMSIDGDGEGASDAVVPAPVAAEDGTVSASQVGCAVFVAGHLALRTLVFLEGLQSALKRKRLQEEDAKIEKEREEKRQKKDNKKAKGKGKGKQEEEEDASTSMGQAGQEEREAEAFAEIAESGLLFGRRSLLDRVKPLIFSCLLDPTMRMDVTLRRLGALSLCKYMTVSKRFCEDNLQLLFSILFPKGKGASALSCTDAAEAEGAAEDAASGAGAVLEDMTLRQSLLVAVGDLLFRHPNTVEPWSTRLYATLAGATVGESEQAAQMRLTALLVLTHLVLNDMMKPRSVLLVRALWLTACPHEPTSRVARILFSELSKRTTNVIYNLLPQIISSLPNHQEAAGLVEGGAEGRVQYIMQFIEKEKHIEGLIEKLTLRLEQAANTAGGTVEKAAVPIADTQIGDTQLDGPADMSESTACAAVSCLSHAIGAMNYTDRTVLRLHDAVVVRKGINTALSYHSVTRDCLMGIVEKARRPKPGKDKAADGAAPEPASADTAAEGGGKGTSAAAAAAVDAIEKLVQGLGRGQDEAKEGEAVPIGDEQPAAAAPEAKPAAAAAKTKGAGRGKRKQEAVDADAEPGFEAEDKKAAGRGRGKGGRRGAAEEREGRPAQAAPARPVQAAPAPAPRQAEPAAKPQKAAGGNNLDRLFGGGGAAKAPKGRGKGRGAGKRRAADDDEE